MAGNEAAILEALRAGLADGPEPLGGPRPVPPRLGDMPEPSVEDQIYNQLATGVARLEAPDTGRVPGARQSAVARFGASGLESAIGLPGAVLEGAGTLLGSDTLEGAGRAIQPDFVTQEEAGSTAGTLGSAVGSGLGFLAAGGAGAAAGLGLRGASALTATTAGLQNMPDAYYGALANGASPEKAWFAALTESAVTGGLEIAGPQRRVLAKVFGEADKATGGGLRSLLVEGLKNAAEEGTEEGLQSIAGDIIAQKLYDVAPDEDWSKILGDAVQAAGVGAAGGGVLGVAFDGVQRYGRDEGLTAPEPSPTEPERTPPVYSPIERDLTPEETTAVEEWKKQRGATRAEVVERPEAEEAVALARKAGADVLFVDDDGSGAKQAATFGRKLIVLPANADPATAMLAAATHEAVHALPVTEREKLIEALGSELKVKGPDGKTKTLAAVSQAFRDQYANQAEREGLKLSKKDLDEEGVAHLAGALAPVVQRLMHKQAGAVTLMHDQPKLAVRVLRFVQKAFSKSARAAEMEKELASLSEVTDQLAKGMTGVQRVAAAKRIVSAFDKISVEMTKPVKVKAKAEPTTQEEVAASAEDVPFGQGIEPGAVDEPGTTADADPNAISPQELRDRMVLIGQHAGWKQKGRKFRKGEFPWTATHGFFQNRPKLASGEMVTMSDIQRTAEKLKTQKGKPNQRDIVIAEWLASEAERSIRAQRAEESKVEDPGPYFGGSEDGGDALDRAVPSVRYALGEDGKKYRYRMQYRPPSFETLPSGIPFETEPASKENPFGVAVYDKPLPFKDEEAFQLEPLDPAHPKNIRKTVEARRERLKDALTDQDTIEGVLNGTVHLFSPDLVRPDKFRLTRFDKDGTLTGHIELGEVSDALSEVARMGFEPKRSDARFSLASDAGADSADIAAARKAWKEQGTESPWFKRWFGASKVVDADGKPLVVYHGTGVGFTEFSLSNAREGSHSRRAGALFFSTDPSVANAYAGPPWDEEGAIQDQGGAVLPVYLRVENPMVSDLDAYSAAAVSAEITRAKAAGHDGVIFPRLKGSTERGSIAVFSPTQIKSATGNRGTFDPTNPDIRYSLKSDIESVAADVSEPEGYQHAIASEEMPSRMVAKYVGVMNPTQRKGVEEMMAEADAILADRSAREKLATRALNGDALNEGEQIALQRIASLKSVNAWRSGTSVENAVQAHMAFRQARTTAGRVLGNPALRDALQSPAERAMGLAMTPSKQVARAYAKAKTWQARRAIAEAEAAKIERIRYSLAEKGYDPRLIDDDYFKAPAFRNVWAESVADGKANGKWDWYIQWRRAAMLSGPITTIRNVTGNTSYVTYDRIARLWADALIPGTGTTVEDARAYARDMFAAIGQGWADARAAYSDFYTSGTEGTSLDEQAAMRRGGLAGKALIGMEAVGVRAQAAQDIFFRTVVGHAETRLRARQKARAEGGSADQYMQDPDVLAMAKEDMERALFLDRDGITRAVTGARDWADTYLPVGSTIVPFASTPTKLVQRGGETLLGPIGGLMRDREKLGGALLGAGAWAAMMWAASMFDDDDGLPLITGSRARGGAGDFQDRTAPAYSIRIGDSYYSYQQIEPLSTALAAIADGIQSGDIMKSLSSFVTAAKDKSFFRSIETVYDAVVGAGNGERGWDRAMTVARDLLWTPMIPNVLRSPLRATVDERTKELGNPLEPKDFANAAIPNGEFAPPLRHDLWGRPVEKDAGSWVSRVLAPIFGTKDVEDVEHIDVLLARYNQGAEADKFFSPPQVYVERGDVKRYWTEEEYSELTRDAGARALTILRPWAAGKTALTERDIDHISEVLSKTRKAKVAEMTRR